MMAIRFGFATTSGSGGAGRAPASALRISSLRSSTPSAGGQETHSIPSAPSLLPSVVTFHRPTVI